MNAVLINPNLVFQAGDPFTTGIVYLPVGLAYVAAVLRRAGMGVTVIDAFAERPRQIRKADPFVVVGLTVPEVIARVPADAVVVFVYAINLTSHLSTVAIVSGLKRSRPDLPVIVLENTQAVTAYSLQHVAGEFYQAGADYILTGEAEQQVVTLVRAVAQATADLSAMPGLGSPAFDNAPPEPLPSATGHLPSADSGETTRTLDELPFPAWDLFPLEGYWRLRFAHGPQSTSRYLALLTSRGCPYPCRFCVAPTTNGQSWRARSARNVVDEMDYFARRLGIREYHLEDLNPTVRDDRIRALCRELLDRGLDVEWKIVAGTKAETIKNEETLQLMAAAGCRYVSVSPEAASPRLLAAMGKPFDRQHTVRLIRAMNRLGIRSQACFVLGFPGETAHDREQVRELVHELTQEGVDEIALFIVTPVPGSAIFGEFSGHRSLSELTFSPVWREGYEQLSSFRLRLYRDFLRWKLRHHPQKFPRQIVNFLRRRFDTKMEMVPYRALSLKWLALTGRGAPHG